MLLIRGITIHIIFDRIFAGTSSQDNNFGATFVVLARVASDNIVALKNDASCIVRISSLSLRL